MFGTLSTEIMPDRKICFACQQNESKWSCSTALQSLCNAVRAARSIHSKARLWNKVLLLWTFGTLLTEIMPDHKICSPCRQNEPTQSCSTSLQSLWISKRAGKSHDSKAWPWKKEVLIFLSHSVSWNQARSLFMQSMLAEWINMTMQHSFAEPMQCWWSLQNPWQQSLALEEDTAALVFWYNYYWNYVKSHNML